MPTKLTTTVEKIKRISNSNNSRLIFEFHDFMKENGTSERHQNNNLKTILSFAQFMNSKYLAEIDKYDLIMTNTPYVTSGSSNFKHEIKKSGTLREYYSINSFGIEGLFIEWIIRNLKPERKAFIIIPYGIFSRSNGIKLRRFIKDECQIDGILSLPTDAFYRNPTKTYILALTKKNGRTESHRKMQQQTDPVFTYLVSNIGETLDVKKFSIDQNDLLEMVSLFNQFKGSKKTFQSQSKRCKIQSIEKFKPEEQWVVDLWWSIEEWVELEIVKDFPTLTIDQFKQKISELENIFHQLNSDLSSLK